MLPKRSHACPLRFHAHDLGRCAHLLLRSPSPRVPCPDAVVTHLAGAGCILMAHGQQPMPFQARLHGSAAACPGFAEQAVHCADPPTCGVDVPRRAEETCLPAWTSCPCMSPPSLTACWRCVAEQRTTFDPAIATVCHALTPCCHSLLRCWLRRSTIRRTGSRYAPQQCQLNTFSPCSLHPLVPLLQAVVFFYLSWTDSRFKNEVLAATNASLNDPNYNNGQVLPAEHSRFELLRMPPALTLSSSNHYGSKVSAQHHL